MVKWAIYVGLLWAGVSGHTSLASEVSTRYQGFDYPNKARNAVSLSFDDGRPSQVDVGTPLLDKYKVKATFYVVPNQVEERLAKWQQAVAAGHEIGNHTQTHACTGNFEWLRAQNVSLEQASLAWLSADIASSQADLKRQLNVTPRSFAYPCGHTFVGRGAKTQSYVPLIAHTFSTGRTWLDETGNNPNFTDFSQLTGLRIDGMSFDEIKTMLEALRGNNAWLILAGHDIGKGGQYTTDVHVLEQLIVYLQDPANGYWLDTVGNVADYVVQHRQPL